MEDYAFGTWVMVGLAVYMSALLAIGWWASKRVSNEADFLVAGRRLGLPLMIGFQRIISGINVFSSRNKGGRIDDNDIKTLLLLMQLRQHIERIASDG